MLCAQDTEQKHGKDGSGAPLSSFLVLLVVVLAEHGGCLSSVDRTVSCESGTSAKLVGTSVRLVGLHIWSEGGARQNECETRCWLTLERVRNSLLESFRSRRLSLGCWS